MKSLNEMKQNGRALRKHLEAAFAQSVTLSQAYEALAVAVGSTSWNALSAQAMSTLPTSRDSGPVASAAALFARAAVQAGYFAGSEAQPSTGPVADGPRVTIGVRDVDLAEPENRDLAKKLCAQIWADCIEEWKKPRVLPCEYIIESSTIFRAMSAFGIEGTDEEGGYPEAAESVVAILLARFGYYAQARRLYQGEAKLGDPVHADGAAQAEPSTEAEVKYSAEGLYNRMQIIEVNLVDVLNEYDVPDECPEWQWVEDNHRLAHKSNHAEPGVWEFMVYVDKYNPDLLEGVPAVLKPFFEEALKLDAPWIMFHQG